MAVCFAISFLVPDDKRGKRSAIEVLCAERYELMKAGVSPSEWARMTRWQRVDILSRYKIEVATRFNQIRKAPAKERLGAVFQAVVARLLGV